MTNTVALRNHFGGEWKPSNSAESLGVMNPATSELLARVPLGAAGDVDAAVRAAAAAYPEWRRTPPQDRIQYLFKLKQLLEDNVEEIARICTTENGKTLTESRAELRRAIENVEVACGIPTLMQGYNLEDVASGIDEMMIRQPLGVTAAIAPFNFPVMIPFWFLPYAIACGNTFILKPSERVPLTSQKVFELMEKLKLPPGVVNMVHGGKPVVDALLAHPDVRAISFVGSTPVAKYVYAQGAVYGKRVQCQGGAKNHVLVLDDADLETSTRIISDSAFGCAGQRCLAVSVAVVVGDAQKKFKESIVNAASAIHVGNGLDDSVQMGPVITPESKARIESLIAKGTSEGAQPLLDGRSGNGTGNGKGNFLKPTILDNVPASSSLSTTEIFGPVLSLVPANTLEEGIEILSRSPYGNMASIFTSSGASARKFRYEVPAGNVGINIGVAAPMAYFPFSGWRDSFLGVLHGQGRDAIEFYTDKKIVVERWPKAWSRKF
ncbi:MAG: CoA-acylating methylmalonate-semialdehyde dehydrogenase [Candidatus Acidiferrales bacterium]|jgi:malonate-semialdehyde dehydrogenase (acetylating)/methylmalonate-semialdehyde dehydrogenase